MNGERTNRWLVVAGGVLIQVCLGAIYAWSAFTAKLTAAPYDFSRTQTQVIFSVALVTFAVVMALVAGRWQGKAGPRVVSMTGGLILGFGYLVAGFSGTSFLGILVGIGLLGGAGIGLAYVCPIAALVKWFPDKKGMITGLAVAGFGFGALIWIKLTGGFQFGPLDLTPGWAGLYGAGWTVNGVFKLYGVLFAALVALGSSVLVNPPEGWVPDGWTPVEASESSGGVVFSARAMVRTPQFWSLFTIFAVGSMAGLMVIGIIRLFGIDMLSAGGMSVAEATVITGTAMGLFYALFNGICLIIWGTVSDTLGLRRSIALMSLLQGIMMLLFYFVGATEWGLYLGAAFIGFNFGGNFALFPAATADLFGNARVGVNYPWVFLGYGVGGVLGPVLGGLMGDTGAWVWAFIPAGVACFAAAALALTLHAPKHPEVHEAHEPVARAA